MTETTRTETAATENTATESTATENTATESTAAENTATESTAAIDHAPLLERSFGRIPGDDDYRSTAIEGEIPAWVHGTYYLNGPARFERAGQKYDHWLDGDGMVCRLGFGAEAAVDVTHRTVRSHKWVAEEEAEQALYRTFGTRFDSDRLLHGVALASPVNVSAYPFAGTLLAFGEQGLPWELDPRTLETRGEHTFGRHINAVSPFSAHANFDYETREMWNFGVSFAGREPSLTLYRFTADGELVWRKRSALPYPASLHDFGLSERFAIFYVNPYLVDVEKLMGGATVMEALSWQPEKGSSLALYDRETGESVLTVPVEPRYCLHQINAYEDGANRLVVDVLELDRPVYGDYQPLAELFTDSPHGRPARYVVDLEAGRIVERREIDYTDTADFPATDPALSTLPYRDFWMLAASKTGLPGRKFFDLLVRGDWSEERAEVLYEAPSKHYLGGEPVFVGNPEAKREAVIINQLYDAEADRMAFALFDAYRPASEPIAKIWLRAPIHLGFHACWVAG